GGGLWWGARLAEVGRVEEPRALWVSLGLAAGMGLAALWRRSRSRGSTSDSVMAPPRRWPAWRLAGFSVLNLAVAAGIAVGFHPRPLG
ncbi:MAG TPA: hypothetical protein VG693_00220, partial [Actinomycetes bacterium]|nr:hypothetical protein [Actinomycetes bacterium]